VGFKVCFTLQNKNGNNGDQINNLFYPLNLNTIDKKGKKNN
jgi:hypothetical protein